MIKLGVCGSRKYPNKQQVQTTIANLIHNPDNWHIISGACYNSPDQWAIDAARMVSINYTEYPAKWKRPDGSTDKGAGFARNTIIANECDMLLAFYNYSNGTMDTITKAYKLNKPILIMVPDDEPATEQELLDRFTNQ